MALKLASDGGYKLNEEDKTTFARQLSEFRGLINIQFMEENISIQMVGSVVSTYPLGGSEIAYIASAEPLSPYLVAARNTVSPLTSTRRIPLITLLQLAPLRDSAGSLAYGILRT